jgi:hypothetical protein
MTGFQKPSLARLFGGCAGEIRFSLCMVDAFVPEKADRSERIVAYSAVTYR